MALRFQLINDVIGSIISDRADPIGINSLTQMIKRSDEYDGVIYDIILDLEFVKDDRMFIKRCYEEAGGIDAEIIVNIYEYDPNNYTWILYYTGRINMNRFDLYEDRVVVALEQTGFQRRVLNLLENDVDIETIESENGTALPANNVITLPLHSKTILNQFDGLSENTDSSTDPGFPDKSVNDPDATVYFSIPTMPSMNEIQRYYGDGYIFDWSFEEPVSISKYDWKIEVAGHYVLNIERLVAQFNIRTSANNIAEMTLRVKLLHGHPESLTTENLYGLTINLPAGTTLLPFPIDLSNIQREFDLNIGDEIYIIFEAHVVHQSGISFAWWFTAQNYLESDPTIKTHIYMSGATTFPASDSKAVLFHEAAQRCCQYYTNQVNCFKSDLLGRIDIGYPVDGEGSLIALTNGNNIRARDRQIFFNLKDLLDFANSLYCVGFGFETIDGTTQLRLEKRPYFYRKNEKILSLGRVYNIKKSVDSKRYYNSVEYGYAGKLDVGRTNAIDEFNTLRRSEIPVVNTKNILKISNKMRAGGAQLEYQRRLSVSTEDGKLDDENFAISVIRSGESFTSKRNEGYAEITNVFDAPSGYNYDLSPARNIKNWLPIIASSLVRSTRKITKFSFGEVNYLMTTRKTDEVVDVAENGNRDVTYVEPLWENEIYSFSAPLTRDQLKLIKASPYGYIEFEDLFGEIMEGYIISIDHDPNKGTAEFELLKVYRP